jgi:hypothetical protein
LDIIKTEITELDSDEQRLRTKKAMPKTGVKALVFWGDQSINKIAII